MGFQLYEIEKKWKPQILELAFVNRISLLLCPNSKIIMGSIKNLKKDLNNVYGEIIDAVMIHQETISPEDQTKSEALIDDIIASFDDLVEKINDKSVENRAAHLKSVQKEIENQSNTFIERLNNL